MAIKKKAKKKVVKKKVTKRKVAKKTTKRKTSKPKKSVSAVVTPKLQTIGEITHFFPHVSAGVIKLSKPVKVGDIITIKGHTTNITQAIDSLQIDHVPVTEATKGAEIGLKVKDRVRIGDIVYKV